MWIVSMMNGQRFVPRRLQSQCDSPKQYLFYKTAHTHRHTDRDTDTQHRQKYFEWYKVEKVYAMRSADGAAIKKLNIEKIFPL